jgi:hypothetical protein
MSLDLLAFNRWDIVLGARFVDRPYYSARSGVTKELRRRKYYEKPCEARRRAHLRRQSAICKGKL